MSRTGDQPLVLLVLLLVRALLTALVSILTIVALGLLLGRLHYIRCDQTGMSDTDGPTRLAHSSKKRLLAYGVIWLVLLAPLGLWATLQGQVIADRSVEVTAHRGHARAAPENTLSAIRKAIASGADYAEVDVHQTTDGVGVLLDDRDRKRVAGPGKTERLRLAVKILLGLEPNLSTETVG